MINFLDELGYFKQKNFYTSKCKIFLHFKATDPMFQHPVKLIEVGNVIEGEWLLLAHTVGGLVHHTGGKA